MSGAGDNRIVRIGGASGSMVDSAIAVPQLLRVPDLNYLALDYLGEMAMGLFRRLKEADPDAGYMAEFIDVHLEPFFAEYKARGIKVVSNAGAMNPSSLAKAIRARALALNVDLKVAAVEGDDLMELVPELRADGVRDMFDGAPLPANAGSVNAYLGAFPIAAALAAGADIVVTGRVVDSALILGPLIHEFGWGREDFDLLAAGTAAGHLLECGAQVSGGTFTDWQDVPDWDEIGYPVGECHADGTVVITKPEGSGGLVSIGTVAEQLLYEVSDPQSYFVPDVVCDFSDMRLEQISPNRVRVSGARGYPPTSTYKVCVTYDDGWRAVALQPIIGIDAVGKARKQADALLKRSSRLLRERNLGEWRQTNVELVGIEASYGPMAQPLNPREVMLKIVVDHEDESATRMFRREQACSIMNMSVGTTLAPLITYNSIQLTNLFSFLLGKDKVTPTVTMNGKLVDYTEHSVGGFDAAAVRRPTVPKLPDDGEIDVPLLTLAWVRSGDKGFLFNVGVIARKPEYLPYIRGSINAASVADCFRHQFADPQNGKVDAYEVPGFHALNFVVHDSQGGGINMSPRFDPAAKSMGQRLLENPVRVSRAIAGELGLLEIEKVAG